MAGALRRGLRIGLPFGAVLLFLALVGLAVVLAGLLGDLPLVSALANQGGMVVYLALLGLWVGAATARRINRGSAALLSGLTAGLVAGVPYAAFVHLLAIVSATGRDLRRYLFQMSPTAIQSLQLGFEPPNGALATVAVLALASSFGALLALAARLPAVQERGRWLLVPPRVVRAITQVRKAWESGGRLRAVALLAPLAGLVAAPWFLSEYWNSTLGTVGIYMLMGLGLNVVVGLAGLLDLGYVAFFAVGAYTVGLLTAPRPLGLELSFWLVLPIAVVVAALSGVLLGLPVLRLRGDYLAIVTLGFGEIIRVLVLSQALAPLLGGPQGIRDIAGPSLLGHAWTSQRDFLYLIALSIALVILVTRRLQNSRLGRSWEAMREDETVARATGVNVYQAKLLAFGIGAAFAGLGGAIFASRNQYTGPEDHVLMVSINVLCLVIVGGMGSMPGIVAGAFVLKGLPEVLRPL